MTHGSSGFILGGLLAVAILQWGVGRALFILLLASGGYVIGRWLIPNKTAFWQWLRSGKKIMTRGD
jgi:uncharacterized membrane protein